MASEDKSEVLVTYVQVLGVPNAITRKIYLDGFEEKALYRLDGTEEIYTGSMLMKAGFLVRGLHGDFRSKLFHFTRV